MEMQPELQLQKPQQELQQSNNKRPEKLLIMYIFFINICTQTCQFDMLLNMNTRQYLNISYKYLYKESRCGSAVKWWKWENKWNQEDPGSLPTPGNLF
jgi:hypothetical protein